MGQSTIIQETTSAARAHSKMSARRALFVLTLASVAHSLVTLRGVRMTKVRPRHHPFLFVANPFLCLDMIIQQVATPTQEVDLGMSLAEGQSTLVVFGTYGAFMT